MTRRPPTCACVFISSVLLSASCAEADPPLPPWADDVQVTGYKWDALPEKSSCRRATVWTSPSRSSGPARPE